MEHLKLYDIDSTELNELIDNKRIKLKHKNLVYKKITDKISESMDNYPNVLALIENNEVNCPNEEECKILSKLIRLNIKKTKYEDRE